ncbi:solute carrier family 22 member 13 [Bombina bombina]|uniref:solute carrier family 22 member 13 n=1 Tax=Bombina bombina TaxID=8345 RepID=UPI00235AC8AD|nr:solute carrier family 22 member 13 [Bombina bombina]
MTDFGEVLKNVGEFGRYQKLVVFMLCFLSLLNAFHMFGQVFMGISVPHYCNTSWILTKSPNLTQEELLNLTIPQNADGSYSQCEMYETVDWDIESIEKHGLNKTEKCQDGWVYDTSEQESTLVTEFDLVCKRKEEIEISQSIYMLGLLIGSLIFGTLGDRIGRRPVILISMLMQLSFGVGTAFVSQFYVYTTLRCFVGIAMSGLFINNLVLVSEWVGSAQRAYATITGHICFAIGCMILAGLVYGVRNWRLFQIIGSVPTALLFFYIWVLPESPRWLLTKGKTEKAKKLLQRAAHINKRTFNEELISELHEDKITKSANMTDLFRSQKLRKITFIMCFVWFVNGLVYYGLSLNVGSFGLDIYLTQLIFGAVEIPARAGSMFMVQILGRKLSQASSLLLGGAMCLIITAIPKDLPVVTTALAVIGKFSIASSFSTCYVYTAELFPTVIRQNGVGLCNMTARVAGILAPLIGLLSKYHSAIPMAIYGSGPVICGVLCFLLPETRDKDLQDFTQENDTTTSNQSDIPKDCLINENGYGHELDTKYKKSTRL